MSKSFRNRQQIFVLGNDSNLLPKGTVLPGLIMFSEPTAMPFQWYIDEYDETDTLYRVYFPEPKGFGNFYSKHIFLTEKEAEERKCIILSTDLNQETKSIT